MSSDEGTSPFGLARVSDTFAIEAIPVVEGRSEPFKLRIQVLNWADGTFTCDVTLDTTFRLSPRFDAPGVRVADVTLRHRWPGTPWRKIRATSAEDALEQALAQIEKRLAVKISRP